MLMKKGLFLFMSLFLGLSYSIAQKGDITVTKDARLNALVAKQSKVTPPDINTKIDGFRIQLYFDSERSAVNDARSRFLAQHPRVDTYVTYEAPNYYLKVGDFRTRLEAEKIKASVEGEFDMSFIVEEEINLPRLNKDKKDKEE